MIDVSVAVGSGTVKSQSHALVAGYTRQLRQIPGQDAPFRMRLTGLARGLINPVG